MDLPERESHFSPNYLYPTLTCWLQHKNYPPTVFAHFCLRDFIVQMNVFHQLTEADTVENQSWWRNSQQNIWHKSVHSYGRKFKETIRHHGVLTNTKSRQLLSSVNRLRHVSALSPSGSFLCWNTKQRIAILIKMYRKTRGQSILPKSHIASHAVIEDWIITFAAYTTAETPNDFHLARQRQKLPFPMVYLDPHLIHGALHLSESALSHPQTACPSVQLLLQGTRTWTTDRQTDTPHYSGWSNRPHLAVAAMRPNN